LNDNLQLKLHEAWFAEMPEYGKLATLGPWVIDSVLNKHQKRSIQEDITNLELTIHDIVDRLATTLNF
jgi:hypothetical protein